MIPGHTKFAPDLLFSKLASTHHKSDVFNENDLQLTVKPYGVVVVDHGMIVRTWRERVGEKYCIYSNRSRTPNSSRPRIVAAPGGPPKI